MKIAMSHYEELIFKQPISLMQPIDNLIGLALGAHRGRMGSQIAHGGNQDMALGSGVRQQCLLAESGFNGLDGVEIPIFTQQQLAYHGQQLGNISSTV
jgi:hypothetical protein